jgi:3-oxoacyl-[acyl-carrier-protein] synthase-3
MMRPEALPDYVLLVAMDTMTRTVDYSDRTAAVLWGDGALAAVISTRHSGRAQIFGTTLDSSPSGNDKVMIPREGYFTQAGRTVQMFAIKRTAQCYEELRKMHQDPDRSFHFVGHQANLRMLESVCQRCNIDPSRHHSNAEWFGNTGSASSGSVISQNWEKWRAEDDVAVVGVGSGLTWGSYMVRFSENDTAC